MSEICTAKIGEQRLETGTLCAICGEFVPIHDVRQTVFPICEECRRRAKKLLYPEETVKEKESGYGCQFHPGDSVKIDARVYEYEWDGWQELWKTFRHHNFTIEDIVDMSGVKGGVVFAVVGDMIGTKHAINVKYLQKT